MAQADYGLVQPSVKLNTPFENLSQVLQLRNQQENARGLAEQRAAIAEERKARTDKIQQENTDRQATGEAIQQGGGVRGTTLDWARANAPNTVPSLTEFFDKSDEKANTIKSARQKIAADEADFMGDVADSILKHGATPGALKLGMDYTVEHFPDYAEQTQQLAAQLQNAPPEQIKAFLEHVRDSSPSRRTKDSAPTAASMAMAAAGGDAQAGTALQLLNPVKPEKAPALGSFEDYVTRFAADRKLNPATLSAGQIRAAKVQYEAAGRAPTTDTEPLVSIMGADGQPVLVRRSQAEGKRPASTREQGRPVTANDASDLADFDTSLDELAAVRAAISPTDSTGIVARAAATVPYVTQITGWGADAKKRQAVIDRVKQVIGKTLEGGVLRKEDEAKYEKILPNIGDSPEVAKAKLDGLDAAIAKRKGRRLDALTDAGYDTGKFTARTPKPTTIGRFTVEVK